MSKGPKKERRKMDVLNDSPIRVLISIGAPLALVSGLSLFTAALTNDIYSKYVGQILFTVTGLISLVTSLLGNVVGSIVSASWIKTARYYNSTEGYGINKYTINAMYSILIVEAICLAALLLGVDAVLHLLSVPEEVYAYAKQYYVIYLIAYMIIPIGSLLVMIVNGIGTVKDIFIVNCVSSCGSSVMAVLLLVIFRGGLAGAAMLSACNSIALILTSIILLKRNNFKMKPDKDAWRPDPILIWDVVRYGLLMAFQIVLCNIGYLFVSMQTNKYLSLDYISTLSVSLPLSGIMGACSTACMVFVPQNYGAGKGKRVKQFFILSTTVCVLYGVFCFGVFALLGERYFSSLFDDPAIVAYGKEYWFWNGLGSIFVAVIYTVRSFLDAVGLSKVSLVSGFGELTGNLICAFWIIPVYGTIGRSISYTLGWAIAAVGLFAAYLINRKRIYGKCVTVR